MAKNKFEFFKNTLIDAFIGTNYKHTSSQGFHIWLKDQDEIIRCVMFHRTPKTGHMMFDYGLHIKTLDPNWSQELPLFFRWHLQSTIHGHLPIWERPLYSLADWDQNLVEPSKLDNIGERREAVINVIRNNVIPELDEMATPDGLKSLMERNFDTLRVQWIVQENDVRAFISKKS